MYREKLDQFYVDFRSEEITENIPKESWTQKTIFSGDIGIVDTCQHP
jgi:hypothetical protein